MENKINVKPEKDRLTNLLDEIKNGKLVVPKFQRDFVWSIKQRLDLFDSINRGFPIGSLLFWNPEIDNFGYNEKIGPYKLQLNPKKYSYVIDGFQRITTLFSALNNPNNYKTNNVDKTILNDYILYYNLKDEEFHHIPGGTNPNTIRKYNIPLYKLVDTFEFLSFTRNLEANFDYEIASRFINRAKKLATKLLDYEIAFVNINGGSIQDAVEIFSRINSKGSDMSPMWMISALTYEDGDSGFKFSDEIEVLKSRLEEYNFNSLKTEVILQCVESSTGKIYFDVKTEMLPKREDFKKLTLSTFTNIIKAARFLYNEVNVLKYSLLPYNLQLIFVTEFFRLIEDPNSLQINALKRWFWQTTYSSYFSIYSLSKQRKAYKKFQNFCLSRENDPLYIADSNNFTSVDFPTKIYLGSVRSKALALFLITHIISRKFNNMPENLNFKGFTNLYPGNKNAELAIPVFINETEDSESQLILHSFRTGNENNNLDYESYFLNFSLLRRSEEILYVSRKRKRWIQDIEKDFVESLGINYTFSNNESVY